MIVKTSNALTPQFFSPYPSPARYSNDERLRERYKRRKKRKFIF
jgi:hypothetical protein